MKLEDYALIGDTQTAALVGRDGSIDWLCLPRFDGGACFAKILGSDANGHWSIAPVGPIRETRRRYRPDSLVLEHELETDEGCVRLVDCMPIRSDRPDVVRVVEGVRGRVRLRTELVVRYDYGQVLPWVRTLDGRWNAVAGPDALSLVSPVSLRGEGTKSVVDFEVGAGERVPFVLTWSPSYEAAPSARDPFRAIEETDAHWRAWASKCDVAPQHRDAVVRSLLTLEALTFAPSGGIVAAPTASLPEALGGVRNWDYRYCWLRDATFTLESMLRAGYREEAEAWRDWLLRAVAGDPSRVQIMYGVAGERRLDERTLDWLPGYEGSRPVRIGNAASGQLQLDVFGEVIEMLFQARRRGIPPERAACSFETSVLDWLAAHWEEPDEGLWEIRAHRQHFVHSKVMAWVAFDRAVKSVERFGVEGPVERWREVRDRIRADVCARGFCERLGSFTQAYGSERLDASLLLLPIVGFLPPHDPRVLGTLRAIEERLLVDGLVARYETGVIGDNPDGLPGREGVFLACSFWLVDVLVLVGRRRDAEALFERLLSIRNDVGLLAEEWDPMHRRLVGNFPQAFSHVGLVNSAANLVEISGPAVERGRS
jgi:GH15 family glucan-1,4-alpha-glucosidase